jgi:hypothetical protein
LALFDFPAGISNSRLFRAFFSMAVVTFFSPILKKVGIFHSERPASVIAMAKEEKKSCSGNE